MATDCQIPSIVPKSLSIMLSYTSIIKVCYEASNIIPCDSCGASDSAMESAKEE